MVIQEEEEKARQFKQLSDSKARKVLLRHLIQKQYEENSRLAFCSWVQFTYRLNEEDSIRKQQQIDIEDAKTIWTKLVEIIRKRFPKNDELIKFLVITSSIIIVLIGGLIAGWIGSGKATTGTLELARALVSVKRNHRRVSTITLRCTKQFWKSKVSVMLKRKGILLWIFCPLSRFQLD
jgi:hypothetical protein